MLCKVVCITQLDDRSMLQYGSQRTYLNLLLYQHKRVSLNVKLNKTIILTQLCTIYFNKQINFNQIYKYHLLAKKNIKHERSNLAKNSLENKHVINNIKEN